MPHRVDPGRVRERVHALTAIAVALSLFVVSVAEASHSHADATESAADCSVCQLGHRPGHTTGSRMPDFTRPNAHPVPAIAGRQWALAILHFSPHRSRAPPLPVSM